MGTFWHVRYKQQLKPWIINLKEEIMKTLKIENFSAFVLSNEEMINVRGGNGGKTGDTSGPTRPPVIIEIWIG